MNNNSTTNIDDINTEIKILMVLLVGESLKIYSKLGKGFNHINLGLVDFFSIKNNLFKMTGDISISLEKSITSFIKQNEKYVEY